MFLFVCLSLHYDVFCGIQVDRIIARMKVAVFFAANCVFPLVVPQTYAEEEDDSVVRETRRIRG